MRAIEYPGQGVTLYRSVLPNGLSVYVVPKPGWRKCRAAFVTSFGGADRRFTLEGERCDTPAGVAHYLEHKMFDMPYGSVDSVFAARGADSNAYTSYAVTSYHFTCTDRFEDDLRTLLAFVSTPYFTPETVEKERGIIGQEIAQGEDDPDWAVYQDCLRLLFGGQHPLGDDVAGTEASIAEITTETLYAEGTDDTLLKVIEDTKQALAALQAQYEQEKEDQASARRLALIRDQVAGIAETWPYLTDLQKQTMIRDCVNRIVITNERVQIFYTFKESGGQQKSA